jgi:hippurate hydrolase
MAAEFELRPGYPVTMNDPGFARFVDDVATEVLGSEMVRAMRDPIMGAEDWSYVLAQVPGVMAFLGACPPELTPGVAPNNHSNRVRFDEDSMLSGVALYAGVAERFLTPANTPTPQC